jgi:hypothetical protein
MFEINTQNNSGLLSLSQAARLTGYHQDYLGQLCRLGKLPAKKVGRNWWTSKEALQSLSGLVEPVSVDAVIRPEVLSPTIDSRVTVQEVAEFPVAIRAKSSVVPTSSSVQNVLTSLRLQSLQEEVIELRRLLTLLMEEVRSQARQLKALGQQPASSDFLRHSYISNFDFGQPLFDPPSFDPPVPADQVIVGVADESLDPWSLGRQPKFAVMTWVVATAVVVGISAIGVQLLTNQFLGQPPVVSTVYYPEETVQPTTSPAPTVAGEAVPQATSEVIPSETGQNVLR